MNRDFIISSLCRIPEGEEEPGLDLSPAQQVTQLAAKLVADHRRGGVLDLSRFLVALHRTLFLGELTPIARGILLAHALEEMEGSDWVTVAADLSHGLNHAQLEGVGQAGLLAMRRALKSGCPERCEQGLARIEEVLRRRAPVEVSDAAGLWVLAEGWGVCDMQARAAVAQAMPELRGRLSGCVVVAVAREEASTPHALIVEHYRRCEEVLSETAVPTLERAARYGRIHLLPQEQLMPAKALSLRERVSAVVGRVSAVVRPVRDRIFVPA